MSGDGYQIIKAELRFHTPSFTFDTFYEFFDRMGFDCFKRHVECILIERGMPIDSTSGYYITHFTHMEDDYGLAPNDPRRFVYIAIDVRYNDKSLAGIIIVPDYNAENDYFFLKTIELTIYSDAERAYTIVDIIQDVFREYFTEYNPWQLEHAPPSKQWSLKNYPYSSIKNDAGILNCLRQIAGDYDHLT